MADRSMLQHKTPHLESRDFVAAFTGAGAAPPVKAATSVIAAADNYATSATPAATRSGAGAYVVSLNPAMKFPKILHIDPQVIGTDGKKCHVVSYSLAAGVYTITVLCYTAAGVAADLAATDTVFFRIFARDSTA
jgi:hypothetical protein